MILWMGFACFILAGLWLFWLQRRPLDIKRLPNWNQLHKQMEGAAKHHVPKKHVLQRGRQLEFAGEYASEASRHFVREICSASAMGGLGIVLLLFFGLPSFLIPAFIIVGLLWPSMKLNKAIRKRRSDILLSLPYYLDLLTLAMEAGLDLIAALDEIVATDRPSPLRDEIALTLKSIQMGQSRSEAFRRLAERTGVAPLGQLASAVTQSEELGSSLGHLLRLQSDALRRQLFREAEEKAQKAPLRMLMPLVLFIFPVAFLLLFVPLIMKLLTL